MRRRSFVALPLGICLHPVSGEPANRLLRKDSFFGLHFDLHPNDRDQALGRDVTDAMVQRLLDQVKPDYIQYDCKGHVGYMGYPSAVSSPASNIVQDSLAIWRRVTEKNGVALYIHFSGVWDSLAIKQHPEWASVRADGTPDPNATSTYGAYVDERMIPQLKEAASKYKLDGAWVDGECWAVRPDYSPNAIEAFRKLTGITEAPKDPKDRGWLEFLEVQREQFRRYLKHYLDVLHESHPGFQIASNWLYTTYVPEKPELPVDFVSGDYLGNASISTARLEARYLSAAGKPWDLMAWGFQRATQSRVGLSHKPAVQLQQEAAVVLAQGGGFQIYYQPTRAGWIDDRNVGVMARVARFCRERQGFSHKTEAVREIGVVFSRTSLYRTANKLFGGWGSHADPARGFVDALVENQYSVDVIPEWQFQEVASQYRMIVLPDWPSIGGELKDALLAYVRGGGTLLSAGAENSALFRDVLAVSFAGTASDQPAFVPGAEVFANIRGVWQTVENGTAEVLESRYPTFDSRRDGAIAATLNPVGSGRIAVIYGPFGSVYTATHAPAARQFLRKVVDRVFTPRLRVKAPPTVEVALRTKGGKMFVHLLNLAQMQVAGEYAVMDYVPPVGPVEVTLSLPSRPARVVLEPGGTPVKGSWAGGTWTGRLDRLDLHSILVFG